MTKLVVFDLDGVLADAVSSWCWVHDYFEVNNDEALRKFLAGEIDDEEFMRRDIALWLSKRRVNISEIEGVLSKLPLMNGAKKTLNELNKRNVKSAIISGGIEIHAKRVADELNITYVMANPLETDSEGYLTGKGILKVPLKEKGKVLVQFLKDVGIKKDECVSVGNSQIDVPMFQNSGLGIAFNPYDDIVERHADIVIRKKDLSEILPHIFQLDLQP